jgi:dienelactone hydrolase
MSDCCLKGFQWDTDVKGKETTLAGISCYVTGSDPEVGILVLHDVYGWTFKNTRLLADNYAEEVGATVYVPDL